MTPDCSARGMMMPRMWEIVCNAPRSDSMGEEKRRGHVARLRSVGCRAGAAPELRRGRFNRKGEARMRFAFSVKSGGAYRGRTDDLLHAMQAL